MSKDPKVTPILFDSYIVAIKNSVGTKMFRNYYALVDREQHDIMKNGDLSCAFYVSSVLRIFDLINEVHRTVDGAVSDMKKSRWRKIKKPKIGAVLVWEKKDFGDVYHKHIGFYIGDSKAISNSAQKKTPVIHNWTFQNTRKVEATYWHSRLAK